MPLKYHDILITLCAHMKHICSGAYVSNVKCMHTSAPGHIIEYII